MVPNGTSAEPSSLRSHLEPSTGHGQCELRKLLQLRHPHEGGSWSKRAPKLREDIKRLLGEEVPIANGVGTNRFSSVRGTHASAPDTADRAVATRSAGLLSLGEQLDAAGTT